MYVCMVADETREYGYDSIPIFRLFFTPMVVSLAFFWGDGVRFVSFSLTLAIGYVVPSLPLLTHCSFAMFIYGLMD